MAFRKFNTSASLVDDVMSKCTSIIVLFSAIIIVFYKLKFSS